MNALVGEGRAEAAETKLAEVAEFTEAKVSEVYALIDETNRRTTE